MEEETLRDEPASELRELLDMMVWDISHGGFEVVKEWREELLSRQDAGTEDVQRAIAVCDDFLAPAGSPESEAARARAWPEYYPEKNSGKNP